MSKMWMEKNSIEMIKMRKTKKIVVKGVMFIMILNMVFSPIISVQAQKNGTVFNGTLTSEDPSFWVDAQWQFYKISVEKGQTVYVQLDYEGNLDIDLRLYWKRENPPGFNGFDLSHCDIDDEIYVHQDNSQLRTYNTTELGQSETISISNPSYINDEDKIFFVLIFSYRGIGSSSFTLTSTQALTEVLHDDTYDCNSVFMFLITYLALAALVFALFSWFIHNKNLRVTGRKKQKKDKEEEAKTNEEEGGVKHVELDTIVRP